ncbi:MAG: hypothetical protein JXA33_24190 [Anaerolineae bacterium]|nr:hypothetical protein [Anaerolineae bacterium]
MVLDPEMLKAYQEWWRAVAEVEKAERQQASLTERWQKLNALFRMAAALGMPIVVAFYCFSWSLLHPDFSGEE